MWTLNGGWTMGLSFKRIAPLALLLLAACGENPSRSPDPPDAHWVSEPAFQIGDALAGDALFGFIPSLRVSPDGRRVHVLEPYEAKVSVWTPDGRRLFDVGGTGKGPGDFMLPYRVHLGDSWFYVRDQSRFTYFSNDRKVLRTVPNPPTLLNYQGFPIRVNAHLSDGSFLGFPTRKPPTGLELGCRDDAEEKPVLRVRETGTGWVHEVVFRRKYGNGTLAVPIGIGCYYGPHPYSDADLYWADPDAGSVVVVRMSLDDLDPGRSELFEVSAAGDTLWKRGLAFQPIRLTLDMLEAALNDLESVLDDRFRRDAVERALDAPEYLPAVSDFALASNGRIWLRSPEVLDTLSVWYSLERGDTESPLRRVLLPEGFELMDATDTHVWGVWKDELDINYVVGRRLVPGS
ncbi:MAG: hypothetical protein OXL34_04650 [Gemmatimonadota bacterium]|nr:hypothetical protein [Gemmatimonadota bacterium]